MSLFLGIFVALVVFFIVVFIHEMGHFLVARWSGVKVLEFGIGIPPRLKKVFRDKKWTDWTLNWFPIGGFVRLKGEDSSSLESKQKDALPMAKWWKQVLILLAGVTMNFILSWIIFTGLFLAGTEPLHIQIREFEPHSLISRISTGTQLIPIFNTIDDAEASGVLQKLPGVILDPVKWGLAEKEWFQRGDVLVSIDGEAITRPDEVIWYLGTGKIAYTLSFLRDDIQKSVTLSPIGWKIGVFVAPNIEVKKYQYSLPQAIYHGAKEVYQQILFSFRTFGAIITTNFSDTATKEDKEEVKNSIGGPVAIGKIFVSMAGNGIDFRAIGIMIAMISLSLWVFNLIPFPALDGGRCLLVLVNRGIRVIHPKFQISPRIEQVIHSVWFMLLILASILVTWKDIFSN